MGSTKMTGAEALEIDYKDSLKSKCFLSIIKSTRKYDIKTIQGFRDLAIQERHLHLSAYLDIIVARSSIDLSKFYNEKFLEEVEERTIEYDNGICRRVADEVDYVVLLNRSGSTEGTSSERIGLTDKVSEIFSAKHEDVPLYLGECWLRSLRGFQIRCDIVPRIAAYRLEKGL
jgi:hypothetical protein